MTNSFVSNVGLLLYVYLNPRRVLLEKELKTTETSFIEKSTILIKIKVLNVLMVIKK